MRPAQSSTSNREFAREASEQADWPVDWRGACEEAGWTPPQEGLVLKLYPAPHPDAGFERVDGHLLVASLDDMLHSFVEEDESPSYTAERIVELSDGSHTVEEIAAQIAREFEGAPLETVEADVKAFVAELVQGKVLVLHNHSSSLSPSSSKSDTDSANCKE